MGPVSSCQLSLDEEFMTKSKDAFREKCHSAPSAALNPNNWLPSDS